MENITTTQNPHQPHTDCCCEDTINELHCEINYLKGQIDAYAHILCMIFNDE